MFYALSIYLSRFHLPHLEIRLSLFRATPLCLSSSKKPVTRALFHSSVFTISLRLYIVKLSITSKLCIKCSRPSTKLVKGPRSLVTLVVDKQTSQNKRMWRKSNEILMTGIRPYIHIRRCEVYRRVLVMV